MTERSDDAYDVVQLPDTEDAVYLIGMDERTTERMLGVVDNRFDDIFENATYVLFTADIVETGDLDVARVDKESVKDPLEDFRSANDAGEEMVALRKIREEAEDDG